MKKKNLHLAIAMTCASISAHAQMYVCTKDSFDAFDHTKGTVTTFREDSLWVGRLGYRIARIDSITFCTPAHPVQALGWWGDVNNGLSQYTALSKDVDGMNEQACTVTFSFEAKTGICLAARCSIQSIDDSPIDPFDPDEVSTGDPYIYVKETQTGVRKFEAWVMNGPVLPNPELWVKSEHEWWADCGSLLAGRNMGEVQTIVETWLHEKGKLVPKTYY